MSNSALKFPHAGKTYLVRYSDDLAAVNAYSSDGKSISYEITEGAYKGAKGTSELQWEPLADGLFLISWQEADGSTVVHHENYNAGVSHAFFTTPAMAFFRFSGSLTKISD